MMTPEFYKSNPNLKRTNIEVEYTLKQIQEYQKCSEDVGYFIEHYVKIIHIDDGLIPFHMRNYQKKSITTFVNNRFVILKQPRQSGKSSIVTSYFLWKVLFHDNQNIAILANKGRLANELLEKIKMSYEHLPKWLQQGVKVWNRGSIELENGSKIMAAATSSSAIRGGTYSTILLDEFSHVPRNIAESFFASVYPTISSGKTTQIIIVSTPLGMNHYYKLWMDAIEGRNDYIPISVHWREIPGRDDAWKAETIRNTSELQFRQEFETQFLGSTNTLINPNKIREIAFTEPNKDKWGLDIYEGPIVGHSYIMPVDSAHGIGGDYSAFTVIDITTTPYNLVAKYRNNMISPLMFPEIIVRYGMYYNNAFVLPETNDVGQQVADSLQFDHDYENMIYTTIKGRSGQVITGGFGASVARGVRMTKQVKNIGCSNIKELIESNKILIRDFDIVEEMGSFISKGTSYEADEGHHDDLMMTLVIFGWLVRQPYFKELSDTDIRKQMAAERYAAMEDDILPAGFIDNGLEEEPDSLDRRITDSSWNW